MQELKKFIPLDEDKEKLGKIDPKKIIQYLKQIAMFIWNSNQELENDLNNTENEDSDSKNYEVLLQKLEADVRQHIRVNLERKTIIKNNSKYKMNLLDRTTIKIVRGFNSI